MKNYQKWYRNISSKLTSHPTLLFLLRSFNRLMTVAMPMVYLPCQSPLTCSQDLVSKSGSICLSPPRDLLSCPCFVRKSITRALTKLGTSTHYLTRIVRDSLCPVATSFQQLSSLWPVSMLGLLSERSCLFAQESQPWSECQVVFIIPRMSWLAMLVVLRGEVFSSYSDM